MSDKTFLAETEAMNRTLVNKWAPVIDHEIFPALKDRNKRYAVARILENTAREMPQHLQAQHGLGGGMITELTSSIPVNKMGASSSTPSDGAIDIFDPVMISLLRRTVPNLISYDIMGVQPMTGPTGLIFAMRPRYTNQTGAEPWYTEVNTSFSSVVGGNNTLGQLHVGSIPNTAYDGNTYNTGSAMSTAQLEAMGTDSNSAFAEMSFSIEKVTAYAKGRGLKASYTWELMQDLKAIHGLEADQELSNILTTELLAEINREAVRTVNICAKIGAQTNVTTAGTFDLDTDSNGRWSVEKFKGLMAHLAFESNVIAKATRRGKGNIMICSSNIASALQLAGLLDYTPALDRNNNMTIDDTGNTFAGILNGWCKVYIDPYATGGEYYTMGYKGSNPFDAGLFYCPYTPLMKVQTVDQGSLQPLFGYKTRYAMVANPYAGGSNVRNGVLTADDNVYYLKARVTNLM